MSLLRRRKQKQPKQPQPPLALSPQYLQPPVGVIPQYLQPPVGVIPQYALAQSPITNKFIKPPLTTTTTTKLMKPTFPNKIQPQFGQIPPSNQAYTPIDANLAQKILGQSFSQSSNKQFNLTNGWPGITCPPNTTPLENARIALLTGMNPKTIEILSHEFAILTNGSGKLDRAKFQSLLMYTIFGPRINNINRLASTIFSAYDSNQTGILEFAEFVLAYKALLADHDALTVLK